MSPCGREGSRPHGPAIFAATDNRSKSAGVRRDVVVKPDRLPARIEAFCHGRCAVSGPLKLIVRWAQQRSNECRRPADYLEMPETRGPGSEDAVAVARRSRLQRRRAGPGKTRRRRSPIGKATTPFEAILRSQANACGAKAPALRRCLGGVICAIIQKG